MVHESNGNLSEVNGAMEEYIFRFHGDLDDRMAGVYEVDEESTGQVWWESDCYCSCSGGGSA